MSAYRDTSQKFKFDYDHNFYKLWKESKFDVAATSPVVLPHQHEVDIKVQITKFQAFKAWIRSFF